jgi:phosphatidylserine synthase
MAIISYVATLFLPPEYVTRTWPFLLLFFTTINAFLFFFYLRVHERKVTAFANFFMLTTSGKLLFYLLVIVGWLYFNRYDTIPFVFTFFTYYIVFTVHEVKSVMRLQTKKHKTEPES